MSSNSPLFRALCQLTPYLPGKQGIFTPYGRIYVDGAHLELATAECSSPYQTPLIAEQLETIVARALPTVGESGGGMVLASVNHDGLLRDDAHWWASHENYLLRRHPRELAGQLLPFLGRATRATGVVSTIGGRLGLSAQPSRRVASKFRGTVRGRERVGECAKIPASL